LRNSLGFAAIGIAVFSIALSVLVVSLNGAENAKIATLQQELDDLKSQLAAPSGRGTVSQQSISKMTNLGSMNNESPNTDTNTRLENVEKQVSQLKSQIESLKP
jgi:hypothetical protein